MRATRRSSPLSNVLNHTARRSVPSTVSFTSEVSMSSVPKSRRNSFWSSLGVMLALPLLPACATTRAGELEGGPAEQAVALHVTNQSNRDVVIYHTESGIPIRLGRVEAQQTTQLIIHHVPKADMLVQLLLRTSSGDSYMPQSVQASVGQQVELTVRPLLSTSEVTVRTPSEDEES